MMILLIRYETIFQFQQNMTQKPINHLLNYLIIQPMGSSDSRSQDGRNTNFYSYDAVQQLIDQFENAQIDSRIFTCFLFNKLDQNPHPILGKLLISNTYILQRFFLLLTNKNKDAKLKPNKIKEEIAKIYKNPQKAIEYSFRLIDFDDDKKISKGQFLSFIDNCFISLQFAAEKKIQDSDFVVNLKNWIKSNKKVFLQNVIKVFEDYAKSNPQFWVQGDFVRWIKDKNHWSLDIEIGSIKLKTPINLLCLFGIQI